MIRTFAVCIILILRCLEASAADEAALRNEAFIAVQWAQNSSAGAALAQLGARFAAGKDELAQAARQRQDLVNSVKDADKQLLQLESSEDTDKRLALPSLRAALDVKLTELRTLDATLEKNFPEFSELSQPKPLAIADVKKLLKDDEALLVTFVKDARDYSSKDVTSYAFLVSKDTDDWARTDFSPDKVDQAVRKLRSSLGGGIEKQRAVEPAFGDAVGTGSLSFDRGAAFGLYQAFLAPFEKQLVHKKKLLIVADGALTSIPFSILVTQPPIGDDADPEALRQTSWLARSYAITTLPGVSSLRALRAFEKRAAGSDPFRGFGAPALKGNGNGTRGASNAYDYFRGSGANVEAVASLPPLPATEKELHDLAKALGAQDGAVLTGEAATVTAVRSADLSKTRILAFATHGLVSGDLKGLAEPALVFTPPAEALPNDDGLLIASEAAQLKLVADWVILSACNTASSDGTPGADGLSGLARAFFYAGARSLLVSHWPVRDDAAARLTTGTFKALRNDRTIGKAEALRISMLELMDDTTDPSLSHPRAWAPFVLVGADD